MGVPGTADGRPKGRIIRHEGSSGFMSQQIEGVAKGILETDRPLLPTSGSEMAGVRGGRDLQLSSPGASLWSFTDFALPWLPRENAEDRGRGMRLTPIPSHPWLHGYPVAVLATDLLAPEPSLTVLSTHFQMEALVLITHQGKQIRALFQRCLCQMAHLHGIYMGSSHAWIHKASAWLGLCWCLRRDEGVCSSPFYRLIRIP